MRGPMMTFVLSAVTALALVFAMPGSSDAQRYRRPHHHVPHHYRVPHGWYHHYRHPYPWGNYYGPGVRYYRYPHGHFHHYHYRPHGALGVGPLRFHLWY